MRTNLRLRLGLIYVALMGVIILVAVGVLTVMNIPNGKNPEKEHEGKEMKYSVEVEINQKDSKVAGIKVAIPGIPIIDNRIADVVSKRAFKRFKKCRSMFSNFDEAARQILEEFAEEEFRGMVERGELVTGQSIILNDAPNDCRVIIPDDFENFGEIDDKG